MHPRIEKLIVSPHNKDDKHCKTGHEHRGSGCYKMSACQGGEIEQDFTVNLLLGMTAMLLNDGILGLVQQWNYPINLDGDYIVT